MAAYKVTALVEGKNGYGVATVEVEAETRAKAITAGAEALSVSRELVTSAVLKNPLSGGGSKKG